MGDARAEGATPAEIRRCQEWSASVGHDANDGITCTRCGRYAGEPVGGPTKAKAELRAAGWLIDSGPVLCDGCAGSLGMLARLLRRLRRVP